jgi:hypothetical protein
MATMSDLDVRPRHGVMTTLRESWKSFLKHNERRDQDKGQDAKTEVISIAV